MEQYPDIIKTCRKHQRRVTQLKERLKDTPSLQEKCTQIEFSLHQINEYIQNYFSMVISGTDLPVKLFCWICTICYASTSASYDCLCFVCSSSHQIDQSWMANSYNSTNQNKNNHNLNSLANVNATNSRFEKDSLKSRKYYEGNYFFWNFFELRKILTFQNEMKGYYSFRLVLEDMLGILKILTKKFVSQKIELTGFAKDYKNEILKIEETLANLKKETIFSITSNAKAKDLAINQLID